MKKIYFMRHGKAEDGFGKSDHERALTEKGRKKTNKIAQFLISQSIKPQQLLVSDAQRTLDTAAIICQYLEIKAEDVSVIGKLYLASSDDILEQIYALDDQIDEVMIIGHNPDISVLPGYLCNMDMDWIPTSSIIGIKYNLNRWNEIASQPAKLLFYTKPSDL